MKNSFIQSTARFQSDWREEKFELPQLRVVQTMNVLDQAGRNRSAEHDGEKLDPGCSLVLVDLDQFHFNDVRVADVHFETGVQLFGKNLGVEFVQAFHDQMPPYLGVPAMQTSCKRQARRLQPKEASARVSSRSGAPRRGRPGRRPVYTEALRETFFESPGSMGFFLRGINIETPRR